MSRKGKVMRASNSDNKNIITLTKGEREAAATATSAIYNVPITPLILHSNRSNVDRWTLTLKEKDKRKQEDAQLEQEEVSWCCNCGPWSEDKRTRDDGACSGRSRCIAMVSLNLMSSRAD